MPGASTMILVDAAVGSNVLAKPLKKLGLPVEVTHLDFGDVAFLGRGIGGASLFIGVELKNLQDLVQSLSSERLQGHQLPGLVQTFDRAYLVVEGEWRHGETGDLLRRSGRHTWAPIKGAPPAIELRKRLLTLATRGGLIIERTTDRRDTLQFLVALYHFWRDKDLDEHTSHLAIYNPDLDRNLLIPPSTFRKIVATLPGVGIKLAPVVEREFKSLGRVFTASPEDWAALTTEHKGKQRKVGMKRATSIVNELKRLI